MRYHDTGEVHKDFHLGTYNTIKYIKGKYGIAFLSELFRRTAQLVYASIYEDLKQGNLQSLLEHWNYYYSREGGKFEVRRGADGIVFHVTDCPAYRHLTDRGLAVDEDFYLQMQLLNRAWSEETPFDIQTRINGPGSYDFIIGGTNAAE